MNLIKRIYRLCRKFVLHCMDDNITVYAAMVSFFLVMSAVPFLMLLISLSRVVVPDEIEGVMEFVLVMMPPSIADFISRLINDLFIVDTSQIVSVTVILALWAASKGIMGLEQGMHAIYNSQQKSNYLVRRLRCTLYTLIFILAIVIAILLLVFGNTISLLLQTNVSFLARMTKLILAFRITISVVIFIIVFTLGFKSLTGVPTTFFESLPGVIFATLGWVGFSYIFSLYIKNVSMYTYLYGSMGALILLLMWTYICILILLIGAEINVLLWALNHHHVEF